MDERVCWICGRNGNGDPLECHHIFGGAMRKKSEKYGLKVYLCGDRCHRNGPKSVHRTSKTMLLLHQWGQGTAMRENNWTIDEFRKEFHKNYLEDEA